MLDLEIAHGFHAISTCTFNCKVYTTMTDFQNLLAGQEGGGGGGSVFPQDTLHLRFLHF